METTFGCLPSDALLIITSNLTVLKDKLSARLVSTHLRLAVSFVGIMKLHMNEKICHPIGGGSGDHLSYLKEMKGFWFNGNHNCKNSECGNIWTATTQTYSSEAVGMTTFYYPKKLIAPHDYQRDRYSPNLEFRHRVMACKNSPSVTRYIPYCEDCMMQYVNLGRREDGLDVPFSQGASALIKRHYQVGAGYGINNF